MRRSILTGCVLILIAAVSAKAQGRGGASSDNRGGNSSISSRGSGQSAPVATTTSRDYSNNNPVRINSNNSMARGVAPAGGSASAGFTPDLTRTSFSTANLYFRSQDYFWHLYQFYGVNPLYFQRFYRNTEPLLTPQIAKLTLRQPLELSTRMVEAVDQLAKLLQARDAGQPVSASDIALRTNEIRMLARKVRDNQTVDFFDQRKDTDVLKGLNLNSAEAVSELRYLVVSLNAQLKGLYEEPKPFTVSVGSLTQPSFQSLSKGIEKLSKSIESSARKI